MRVLFGFEARIALVGGLLTIAACAVDHAGLATGSLSGSGGDGIIAAGGSTVGSGGSIGAGGDVGTGGAPGTGGALGSGGSTGTGGATAVCNASTCPDGCCMGGRCLTGGNDTRCGNGGVACTPCAACYRCGATHTCEVMPSSTWNVICASATIASTKPTGLAWDVAGPSTNPAPDPYCQLVVDGAAGARTTTVLNTVAPVWNQSITPNLDVTAEMLSSASNRLQIGVIDEDMGVMPADPVCAVTPHLTGADFASGTIGLPVGSSSCTSLTIQVVCAQ